MATPKYIIAHTLQCQLCFKVYAVSDHCTIRFFFFNRWYITALKPYGKNNRLTNRKQIENILTNKAGKVTLNPTKKEKRKSCPKVVF